VTSVATFVVAYTVVLALITLFIFMNERYGLLSSDHFPTPIHKWGAYAWFSLFLLGLTTMVVAASAAPTTVDQLKTAPYWSLFVSHVLLLIFLAGWWGLAGAPPLKSFLNMQGMEPGTATLVGIAVGVGGWALTIVLAMIIGAILVGLGATPDNMKPSPMIPWMAALPFWKKALIVFMAMTVEEFFFRGWLQKRVGLIISTIIFALAHAGYGQPLMLVGITIVSLIIGYTFYRTRNLWPCIIAHGVFDAIQLFVIVPVVVKMTGM
jgi:membrane protease YdiL (CAAX protease family)